MGTPDRTDSLALLERFVVENDALADLEAEIGRLNIFDALGIVHAEIRHSNFLAWLLDPNESHGQGQLFLNAILMDLLRNAPHADRPLSPVDLDGADLRGVQVRREWRHIDLLIVVDEPRVVIAIENKIFSSEHSNQLKRYKDAVATHFPGHRPFYVFLTREGDEPSEEVWCPYDFGQLHTALERCVRRNEDSIGEEVRVFVGHYLAMLRSRFMDDPKIDELVDRIYRNHRQALDLIFERKSDPRANLVRTFIETLQTEVPDLIVNGGAYGKAFAPQSFARFFEGIAENGLYRNAQLHGHIHAWHRRLSTWISYRATEHSEQEEEALRVFRSHPKLVNLKKLEKSSDRKKPIYSFRIIESKDGLLDDSDSTEKAVAAARKMAQRFRDIEQAFRDART